MTNEPPFTRFTLYETRSRILVSATTAYPSSPNAVRLLELRRTPDHDSQLAFSHPSTYTQSQIDSLIAIANDSDPPPKPQPPPQDVSPRKSSTNDIPITKTHTNDNGDIPSQTTSTTTSNLTITTTPTNNPSTNTSTIATPLTSIPTSTPSVTTRTTPTVKPIEFFGIVGLIRFLHGYYLTIITKCSPVALIAGNTIYHVDDTRTLYLPTRSDRSEHRASETRYRQIFDHIDLAKNFYFSYSYDLTRTLEANLTSSSNCYGNYNSQNYYDPSIDSTADMFMWNSYLREPLPIDIASRWTVRMIHGFVDQAKLSVFGRSVFVTLIARRSRLFAGTRYLKRGANDKGSVANEVETEQIVFDAQTSTFFAPLGCSKTGYNGNFTSFVQHRGSIPLFWTQDAMSMAAKPPIELNLVDPFYSAAALHFNDMFRRYGSPIIILNLVKSKEKTPRESILLREFTSAVKYLNQFLPLNKKLEYIAWDMARAAKARDQDVVDTLRNMAERIVKSTKFFHSGSEHRFNYELRVMDANDIDDNEDSDNMDEDSMEDDVGVMDSTKSSEIKSKEQQKQQKQHGKGQTQNVQEQDQSRKFRRRLGPQFQTGIVRTNCIDCLDRTNAAQFVIGKCAFAHQLYALGILDEPSLPFDCDAVNMLNAMYHDHGDTVALQYGGSHLVNTMATYRKISPWTSHSRDMIESIKRYYSNSFTDAEKQDAINLFLGNFRADPTNPQGPQLWDLKTDYYLHNNNQKVQIVKNSYTHWFDDRLTMAKQRRMYNIYETIRSEMAFYNEYYQPHVFTVFANEFARNMMTTITGVPSSTVHGVPSTTTIGHNSSEDGGSISSSPFELKLMPRETKSPLHYSMHIGGVRRWLRLQTPRETLSESMRQQAQGSTTITSGDDRNQRQAPWWTLESTISRLMNPNVMAEEASEYANYVDQYKPHNIRMAYHRNDLQSQHMFAIDQYDLEVYKTSVENACDSVFDVGGSSMRYTSITRPQDDSQQQISQPQPTVPDNLSSTRSKVVETLDGLSNNSKSSINSTSITTTPTLTRSSSPVPGSFRASSRSPVRTTSPTRTLDRSNPQQQQRLKRLAQQSQQQQNLNQQKQQLSGSFSQSTSPHRQQQQHRLNVGEDSNNNNGMGMIGVSGSASTTTSNGMNGIGFSSWVKAEDLSIYKAQVSFGMNAVSDMTSNTIGWTVFGNSTRQSSREMDAYSRWLSTGKYGLPPRQPTTTSDSNNTATPSGAGGRGNVTATR